MKETRKILLVTTDTRSSHHGELRAALLGAELRLDAFEMLTVKRAALGFASATTAFSHIEVRENTLSAWLDGGRNSISVHGDPDALDAIWREVPGTAAELVVDMARSRKADLTVLAPCRRNRLLALLLPSEGREILRRCHNSLLLVHREPRDGYRKVLVAVDFSAECDAAARLALAMAPNAHFTFVHAYRLPDETLMRELEVPSAVIGSYLARGCQTAWEHLNRWIAGLGPVAQPCVGAVHSGAPVAVINATAQRIGADLIVAGRQGRTRSAHDGLGEVARRLGATAACDVLIGPPLTAASSAHAAMARLGREARTSADQRVTAPLSRVAY